MTAATAPYAIEMGLVVHLTEPTTVVHMFNLNINKTIDTPTRPSTWKCRSRTAGSTTRAIAPSPVWRSSARPAASWTAPSTSGSDPDGQRRFQILLPFRSSPNRSFSSSSLTRGCRMCNSPFLFRGQGQLMLANRSMAVVKFWTASSALPSSMPSWTQRRICSSRTT